jgi:transposase-like protein
MKKLSKDTIDQIINLYIQGESPSRIGEKYNIFSNSVNRIIRKHNPQLVKTKKINDSLRKEMASMYQEGMSSEEIAKKIKIDGSTVCRNLKRENVFIRSGEDNKRKYKINKDYFQKIDSEDKAYFLGFLYADGSVSKIDPKKSYSSITICLSSKDRFILEKFSDLIYGFVKIRDFSRRSYGSVDEKEYSEVSFYSKKMHSDLVKLGCTPQKSLTIKFPTFEQVPEDLIKHFIRGYFDGDGCLSRGIKYVVDITSNEDFLIDLVKYVEDKLEIKFNKLQKRHKERETSTRNVQITKGESIVKFLNYLYSDATIFLPRKREYFEEMIKKKPLLLLNLNKQTTL